MNVILRLFEFISGLKLNFSGRMFIEVYINEDFLRNDKLLFKCKRGNIAYIYVGLPVGENSRKTSI